MDRRISIWLLLLPLLLVFLGWIYVPAFAQEPISIHVSSAITDQFPQISLYISITDASGERLANLPAESFTVIEDDTIMSGLTVEEVLVGTRQIFLIDDNHGLQLRDVHGQTRFDLIRQALIEWWSLPKVALLGVDDFSLLTAEHTLVAHSQSSAELAAGIDHFSSTFDGETPPFELVQKALNYADGPPLSPGMANFLIFITPLTATPDDLSLVNAIARANETDTAIYPILMAAPDALELPEVESLHRLASETGGELILFDPELGLEGLAKRILTRQYQYRLCYSSHAGTTGNHTLQIKINHTDIEAESKAIDFWIDVLPPEVVFISPPTEIVRHTDDPAQPLEEIPPVSQDLHLLISFTDGYSRPITLAELIIDDEIVYRSNEPPFDHLLWDLSGYKESATHTLVARVEDSLGLQAETIKVPVTVSFELPPSGLAALRPTLGTILFIFTILLAGAAFAAIFITRSRARASTPVEGEAVGQSSMQIEPEPQIGPQRIPNKESAEAVLIPQIPNGEPIDLIGVDCVFGCDATLARVVLPDPSVSGMHARLIRHADGRYMIRDIGSVAGTWVNYDLIPESGKVLCHGDLIHLGRVAFRFYMTEPPSNWEIKVQPVQDKNPSSLVNNQRQEPKS